jgi:hypothetical protein
MEKGLVGQIVEYESGEMGQAEMVQFFQEIVNSGMAWELQGSYGRTAMNLIEAGLVSDMRC